MTNRSPYMATPVRVSDLSASARIRNAALEAFAEDGIASTTIRGVAERAGVSAGLVQHHFGTKAGLRDAVNEHVIAIAMDSFRDLVRDGEPSEVLSEMGDRVTAFVRDNSVAVRYIARALIEGDAQASQLFDALYDIALKNWLQPTARQGVLHRQADLEWAAMHVVLFNLATVLFEQAINRHLPEPLFTTEQLRRWNVSTTDLYRRGLYDRPAAKRTRSRG